MGDFTQPQQKCAATGENCNPCHFLTSNKNFMKIFVLIHRVCKHLDIKFESKKQFCKYVKNNPKIKEIKDLTQFYLIFGQFLTYLRKKNLLPNSISKS